MSNIIGFLESIEKLAYKILLWLILIPKTIVQITINPGWAPEYIKGELQQEKSPFDEYISPIVLLLIVALIPAMVFNFLPVFGMTISSPAEKEATTDRFLMFDSETSFKSGSTRMWYTSSWFVEEITGADELGNAVYNEIYRENHDKNNWYIEDANNSTTKDAFYYEFKPGEYFVYVYVEKIDTEKNNVPVESYDSSLSVYVPENPEEQIFISNYSPNLKSKQGDKQGIENLTDQIKKESTIFLALGLLIPPLLFALATKLFTSEAITENALRESFYAQCYYFTPINLAFWASYYADYFFTPDIFGYKTYDTALTILYLPLLLAVIWFIGIETQAVARERQTRGWFAFLIVLICVVILGVSIGLVTSLSDIKDNLRVTSIWIYPVATGALLLAFAVSWYKRKKAENRKIRLGEVFLISALLLILALYVIAFVSGEKISPSIPIPDTNLSTDAAAETSSSEIQESPPATEPPAEATAEATAAATIAEAASPTVPAVNVEAQIKTARILVYEDTAAEGLWIEPMLKKVGYAENAKFVHDRIGNLKNELTNPDAKWDLIMIAAESRSAVSGELWVYVKDQLDAGTPVIIETWTIHTQLEGKIKPILEGCGVQLEDTMDVAVPVLWYDPDNPFFNSPNQVGELSKTNRYWSAEAGDFMKLSPGSDATILAGTNSSLVDKGVIVSCYDGRMILQTFSNHDYPQAQITQLWQNYVYNLLSNHFSK